MEFTRRRFCSGGLGILGAGLLAPVGARQPLAPARALQPRPRTANAFTRAGQSIVAKVPHLNGNYLPDTIAEALALLGG